VSWKTLVTFLIQVVVGIVVTMSNVQIILKESAAGVSQRIPSVEGGVSGERCGRIASASRTTACSWTMVGAVLVASCIFQITIMGAVHSTLFECRYGILN